MTGKSCADRTGSSARGASQQSVPCPAFRGPRVFANACASNREARLPRAWARSLGALMCLSVAVACSGDRAGEVASATPGEPSPYTNTPRGGTDVRQVPGRPIGTITTVGEVAVLELDPGVIAEANLFDLDERTLRFTPDGEGYRVQNLALMWESDIGEQMGGGRGGRGGGARAGQAGAGRAGGGNGGPSGPEFTLTGFEFPFAGRTWTSVTVNPLGLITFGGDYGDLDLPRFIHMQTLGPGLVNTLPMISVFLKQRMRGSRFVNELADRLVVTWDMSEPSGGNQDMTFEPTPNRFQAVLHADGTIDLSYEVMTARDGIVGVYSAVDGGAAAAGGAAGEDGMPAGAPTAADPVDLSALTPAADPASIIYESFHHYGLPRPESLACTVIEEFGDNFDFMTWYSDFRVDDQEAGTRSVGDIGQQVQGIGPRMDIGRRSSDFCSDGRLQVTWFQPVYIGSNQAQERTPDGRLTGYNMAMAQISHEHGHRWSTRTRAIVNGDTIELRGPHDPWGLSGATHWPSGLHTPVPYPPDGVGPEGSIMGGSNWQDNGDGTYTLLDRGSMVPSDGYSYLELYLMGLLPAEEVPPFFLLEDTEMVGRDEDGRAIYTAGNRIDITIDDVIAHNGPRVPSYEDAPKDFNMAFVAVVLPGQTPSQELLEGTEGIRSTWIDYWSRATGGRSTMTTTLGPN